MTPHTLTAEDLEFSPPSFPAEALAELARDAFGIEGGMTPLQGERDQNTKITTSSGEAFVLKVANAFEDPGIVDLQIEALLHFEAVAPELATPRIVRTVDGDTTVGLLGEVGQAHPARLLTFLPGDTFGDADVQQLSSSALRQIGRQLGRLCWALASFDHPHAEHFMAWDISNGLVTSEPLWAHAAPDVVELAGWTRDHLANSAFTQDTTRRRQLIHNDAHRGNVLRAPGTADVVGLIDFGDMVEAPISNELAIPAVSFVNAAATPLESLAPIVAGFHEEHPLEPIDIHVLLDATIARAVLTVVLFDFQLQCCPHLAEAVGGARPRAMNQLRSWLSVDPAEFVDHISSALEGTTT